MKSYLVLIVDDSPENLEIIVEFLGESDLDITILKAPNGKVACKLAEKKLPDLIITDWDMPEMDGVETIVCLKNSEKTKEIPVIMATGVMTGIEHLKIALDAGAVDYIRKPIEKIELIARVNSMLKLAESYKEIKHLNATKNKLFSIIAHDLKAPFSGLLSLSELFHRQYDDFNDDKRRLFTKTIYESSKTTFNLLQNLLTWSATQREMIAYKPEYFSINQIVLENIELLENTANEKEIAIVKDFEKEITVFADKNMILTVLRNLLSNAIKFTQRKGTITVSTKQIDEKIIKVSVMDTGVGISEEKIAKLFSIDQNFTTRGTENEIGIGLGLISCNEFIEKHNSKIWVESKVKIGSTFSFILPISNA